MATQVDNRVVEMTFDNARFEKNVKQSMESIKQLDKDLKTLEDASFLKDLDKSVKNFSLDSIANSLDNLNNRFSTTGIIGMTVISRLTNSALDFAKKVTTSFTSMAKAGGMNRALNIEQAEFQLKGLGMNVSAVMDDVNYAVDGTAYGLDAAAKVAAQFGASGVKAGDKMKSALRGVSGVAAMTGASYEDIGRIFATVAGNGRVMASELNQIGARGLNAAAALAKYLGVSEAEVRSMTSKGKIDFETFAAAMDDAFGEHAKDANKTFTGALSNMKAAVNRIGADFMQPYITNMRDVFNAVRPWLNNLRTALKPVAADAENVMIGMNKRIVKSLEDDNWVDAQVNAVEIFRNSLRALLTIFDPIAKAWKEVFPKSAAQTIKDFTSYVRDFTAKLGLNQRSMVNLRDTFKGLFSILKVLGDIFGTLLSAIFPFTDATHGLLGVVLDITGALGRLVTAGVNVFNKFGGVSRIFNGVRKAAIGFFSAIIYGISSLFEFVSQLKVVQYAAQGVEFVLTGVVAGIALVIEQIQKLLKSDPSKFFKNLKTKFTDFINSIKNLKIVQATMTLFTNLLDKLGLNIDRLKERFEPITELFQTFKERLDNALDLEGPIGFFKTIISFFGDLIVAIKQVFTETKPLTDQLEGTDTLMGKISDGLKILVEGIKKFVSELTPGKIAAFAFSLSIVSLAFSMNKGVEAVTGLLNSVKGFFGNVTKLIKGFQKPKNKLLEFAEAIAILSASLIALTLVDPERLKNAAKAIGFLVAELAGIGVIFSILGKFKVNTRNFAVASRAMEALAVSVGILSLALIAMNFVNMENIGKKLLTLLGVMASLATVATVMSKFAPQLTKGSIFMLAFSLATKNVTKALASLESVNLEEMGSRITALFVVMTGLAILAKGVGSIRLTSVVGLFALVSVLKFALPAIKEVLSAVNVSALQKRIEDSVFLIAALSGLALLMGFAFDKIGDGMKKFGLGLLALSGAIVLLAGVAKTFTKLNLSDKAFVEAGIFVAGALVLFGLIIKAASGENVGKYAVKLGLMAVGISTAILLLAVTAKLFSKMDWGGWFKAVLAVDGMLILFAIIIRATKYAEKIDTKVILGAILGIVVLMGELVVLSLMKWHEILPAAFAMGLVLLAFSKSMELLSRNKFDPQNIMGMVAMAIIVGEFAIALHALADKPWESLLASGAAMTATMIAFMEVLKVISSRTGLKVDKLKQVIAVAVAMIPMAIALSILAKYEWDSIFAATAGMAATLLAVAGVLAILGKVGGKDAAIASVGIIATAGAMVILAYALKQFTTIDWNNLGSTIPVLLGMATVLSVLGILTAAAPELAIGLIAVAGAFAIFGAAVLAAGAGITLAGVGLNLLIPALEALTNLDLRVIGDGILTLAPGLGLLGLAGVPMILGAAGIAAGALALMLLGPALSPLQDIDMAAIGQGMVILAGGATLMGAAGMILALGAPGIIAAGLGLIGFATGALMLNGLDMNGMGQGLLTVAVGGSALGAAGVLMLAGAPGLLAAGSGLLVLSAGLTMFGNTIERVVPQIQNALNLIFNNLVTDAAKAGHDAVKGLIESITSNLGAILNTGKKMAKSLLDGIRQVGGWHSPWTKMVEAGVDADLGLALGVTKSTGEVARATTEMTEKGILSIIRKAIEKVKGFFSKLGIEISGFAEKAGIDLDNLGISLDDVKDKASDLGFEFEDLTDWTEKFAGKADEVLDTEELLNDETEDLTLNMDDLGQSMESAGGSAGKAENAFSKLTDTIANQMDIFSKFDMKTEMTGEEMLENMRSQIQGVSQWADNLTLLAERGIDKGLLQKLTELGPQGYEKVAAFVQMTDEQLSEAGSLFAQSLTLPQSAAQQILGSYADTGRNAATGFISGLKENEPTIVDAAATAALAGLQAFNKVLGVASPSRETMDSAMWSCIGFANGLVKYSYILTNQIIATTNLIIKTFNDGLPTWEFSNMGQRIVEGIAAGIRDNITTATMAAQELANSVIVATSTALAIHSPSLEFWKIGKYVDEGLAKGISNNGHMVYDQVDEISVNLIDRFNNITNTIISIFERDLDQQPMITPTLDLSNLIHGVNQIDGMFESQRLGVYGQVNANGTGLAGGNNFTFNQYNTSPKALSRIDIYRQTNNQISRFKREVESRV